MNRETPPTSAPLTPALAIEAIKDVYGELEHLRDKLLAAIGRAQASRDWKDGTRSALIVAIINSQRITNDLEALMVELERK